MAVLLLMTGGLKQCGPDDLRSPASVPGVWAYLVGLALHCFLLWCYYAWVTLKREDSALALLVARVFADYEYVALAANHLALVANPLHARLDLHGFPLRSCSYCSVASASGGPGGSELNTQNRLLVAVDNTAPGEVVRAKLHYHPVLGEDSNVVLTHLSRDVG